MKMIVFQVFQVVVRVVRIVRVVLFSGGNSNVREKGSFWNGYLPLFNMVKWLAPKFVYFKTPLPPMSHTFVSYMILRDSM